MKQTLQGIFWIGVYLALVLAPLFALLLGPVPRGGGFWWDFSIALGFAGTAMMGVMFVLTARFRRPTAPFGIDLIYYFHRQISLVALFFLLLHPVILLLLEPAYLPLLNPFSASWELMAGVGSLAALAALVFSSLWRKELRIHYDGWRMGHALLAVVALGLAILHIEGVGNYSAAPWARWLWGVFTAFWITLLLYIRLLKPFGMLRRPWRVTEVIPERGDATTLVLRPEGHGGFSFLPGQFAWLTLRSSPFALREHPFSIASSAERPQELRLTIKALGDFTRGVAGVQPGEKAYLDGPFGAFGIDRHQARGLVFVAGGIGIAPVMSMLRTLADRGDRRPLRLFYAYSSWERLTFREEIEGLKGRLNLGVVYVLGEPPEGWAGEKGLLSEEILARHLPGDRLCCEYFVCGPVPMIDLSERALHRLGVPLSRIHSELFDLV